MPMAAMAMVALFVLTLPSSSYAMNILTLPLAAVSAFTLCLAYAHLNQEEPEKETFAPESADYSKAELHLHDEIYLSPGKPSAAVVLLSDGVQTLELQRPTKLNLQLQNRAIDGTVTVSVTSDNLLQLLSARQQWSFQAAQTPVINLPLELVAHADGAHHLHLFIEHVSATGAVNPRAMALQFNVGASPATMMYSKHSADNAEQPGVIRLQADEEIY